MTGRGPAGSGAARRGRGGGGWARAPTAEQSPGLPNSPPPAPPGRPSAWPAGEGRAGKEGGTGARGRGAGGRSPGCKLTPARLSEPGELRRAHTLAFTLASRWLTPSGAAPPRSAHGSRPQTRQDPQYAPRRPCPHPPADHSSSAPTLRHPPNFLLENPQNSALAPHPLPLYRLAGWAALPPAGKLWTHRRLGTRCLESSQRRIAPGPVSLTGCVGQGLGEMNGIRNMSGDLQLFFSGEFPNALHPTPP